MTPDCNKPRAPSQMLPPDSLEKGYSIHAKVIARVLRSPAQPISVMLGSTPPTPRIFRRAYDLLRGGTMLTT